MKCVSTVLGGDHTAESKGLCVRVCTYHECLFVFVFVHAAAPEFV